jgi:hypothetical protein
MSYDIERLSDPRWNAKWHVIFQVSFPDYRQGEVLDYCREDLPAKKTEAEVIAFAESNLSTVERQCRPGTKASYRLEIW